jgi:predicted TPR repeat methyltransferase
MNTKQTRFASPDNHYTNPRLAGVYDMTCQPSPLEKTFYLSLAKPHNRTVLDVGCGVGILCDAFAENGHQVTGVDPAAAMLAAAAKKPHSKKVEWVQATAQGFKSQRRFDLIVMTGHAFQVLLSDDDIVAATAKRISFEHYYQFPDETLSSPSTLRFASCDDIRGFLDEAGLRVASLYGDWAMSPFDYCASSEMIFIAKAKD